MTDRPKIERGTFLIIRTDGTRELVAEKPTISKVGASTLDTVNMRDDLVMIVDDNGWECETIDHGDGRIQLKPVHNRLPINAVATALYHSIAPGTAHQIVGDVALVRDSDFA